MSTASQTLRHSLLLALVALGARQDGGPTTRKDLGPAALEAHMIATGLMAGALSPDREWQATVADLAAGAVMTFQSPGRRATLFDFSRMYAAPQRYFDAIPRSIALLRGKVEDLATFELLPLAGAHWIATNMPDGGATANLTRVVHLQGGGILALNVMHRLPPATTLEDARKALAALESDLQPAGDEFFDRHCHHRRVFGGKDEDPKRPLLELSGWRHVLVAPAGFAEATVSPAVIAWQGSGPDARQVRLDLRVRSGVDAKGYLTELGKELGPLTASKVTPGGKTAPEILEATAKQTRVRIVHAGDSFVRLLADPRDFEAFARAWKVEKSAGK